GFAEQPAGPLLVACLHKQANTTGCGRHSERRHGIAALDVDRYAVAFKHVAPDAGLKLVAGASEEDEAVSILFHGSMLRHRQRHGVGTKSAVQYCTHSTPRHGTD